MLEGKLALGGVTRVSLPQDSMAVTRNNLATFKSRPDVLLDSLIGRLFPNLGLHLTEPDENLLVSKTVKRAGETVESGSIGKERIRESRADKFTGVSRDIATLMVTGIR